jgi:hypothetical protein
VDGGSWRTIMTVTASGTTVGEAMCEADGNNFTAGREYEFDVESTGGAEFTALEYGYEILTTNI